VHGLITLLLDVIALAIILLLVRVFVLVVLVFAARVVMVLIVLMLTVVLSVVVIKLVASMVVGVLVTMLPVTQIAAVSKGKMNHLLLFLLLLLRDLVKVAGCFTSSLTLLKKGYEPKRVRGHCLVCFCKLVLMHLVLCKEDLFALLLDCG
jgi:hypothetical protein